MKGKRLLKAGLQTISRHKVRTFFMMLGIIVGITALTVIVSFGKGAEKKMMDKVEKLFSAKNIFISGQRVRLKSGRQASTNAYNFTIADLEAIEAEVPNVYQFDPMIGGGDREVKAGGRNLNIRVYGHSPKAESVWNRSVTKGEFFDDNDMNKSARVALIGEITAKEFFDDNDPIGKELRIGNVPFKVKGVLESIGVDPHGNNRDNEIHVPITTAMRRLYNVDYINGGKIEVKDPGKMNETISQIEQILRERHKIAEGEPNDFFMMTPLQVQRMVKRATQTFDLFLPLIALIALLVGGVVVANLMLVVVKERTSEIGLRKAVGARSKDILNQFLMETTMITGTGGVIGIIIGAVGVQLMSSMFGIPIAFSWQALVASVLFSALIGFIAGVFPARRAAALDPVDTLR